jgi:hypothetical protein
MTGLSVSRERAPSRQLGGPLVDSRVLSTETGLCHCGHPIAGHDAIGKRFCAASSGGDLVRGCVCGPTPAHSGR